jgi:hypothetical protein
MDADGTVFGAQSLPVHLPLIAIGHSVVVGGSYQGTIELAGEQLPSGGGPQYDGPCGIDGVVANVTGRIKSQWAKSFATAGDDVVHGLAGRPDGGAVIAGEIGSSCQSLGGVSIAGTAFVAALDHAGDSRWRIDLADRGSAQAIAAGTPGGIFVAGSLGETGFGHELFVAKLLVETCGL